jgi:SAM-dependent methyltransferase
MSTQTPAGEQPFQGYARFYDLLYATKSYDAEVAFVLDRITAAGKPAPRRMLDLGCGTGGHMAPLLQRGISVSGVDRSDVMVAQAKTKLAATAGGAAQKLSVGDIREFRDGSTYDVVVSMFAVMGYLTSNNDFLKGLATARAHLNPGGLFLFDVWHGAAVLNELPETRIHQYRSPDGSTLKLVTPRLDCTKNVVSVHYRILTLDGNAVKADVEETHEMRFFFVPEIALMLGQAGFRLVEVCEFMHADRSPEIGTWNLAVVAEAIDTKKTEA